MEIITYAVWIALWLLSGFLAAWIAACIHPLRLSLSRGSVVLWSVVGPAMLLIVSVDLWVYSEKPKKPFFKAKEPK